MTTKKKAAVGMSGGVDSSVAAAILVEQGYDVTGVFIEAYNEQGCRTDQDKKDALNVALQLGIKFEVLDVRKEYKSTVVDYFLDTYRAGKTPNPDVVCNEEVKFGIFYDWALRSAQGKLAFDFVATGHYARIAQWPMANGLWSNTKLFVQRAKDLSKDQSYFLYRVPQDHLNKIAFPLGAMLKKEVREKAKNLGFANANKPDSMGVCMMGEFSVHDFLNQKLGENPGEVIMEHEIVGKHKGLWFHTIGQRGGMELYKLRLRELGYKPEEMEPLYVTGKDVKQNRLIIGTRAKAYSAKLSIINYQLSINFQSIKLQTLIAEKKLFVRVRNLGDLELVKQIEINNDQIVITTAQPLFGVAEGQAAVLYAGLSGDGERAGDEIIVAGGEISVY